MKIAETTPASEKRRAACPMAQQTLMQSFQPMAQGSQPSVGAKKDRITFGMSVNWKAGCCVDKVKTGREGGCCAHIPHEKFVGHYREAVHKETEKTGKRPDVDPDVQAILDGKPPRQKVEKPADANSTTVEVKVPALMRDANVKGSKKTDSVSDSRVQALWQRVALAPARWFQWLLAGFWKDMKLLFFQHDRA